MKEDEIKTHMEVFICNHSRDGKDDDCASKGAKDLTDKLNKWAKEHHHKEIKVYRSGCLGKCSEGIAIACYPEKKLLLEVEPDDAKEIKEGLEEALKKFRG